MQVKEEDHGGMGEGASRAPIVNGSAHASGDSNAAGDSSPSPLPCLSFLNPFNPFNPLNSFDSRRPKQTPELRLSNLPPFGYC